MTSIKWKQESDTTFASEPAIASLKTSLSKPMAWWENNKYIDEKAAIVPITLLCGWIS